MLRRREELTRLIDADNGEPFVRTSFVLASPSAEGVVRTTDEHGAVVFDSLPEGTLQLTAGDMSTLAIDGRVVPADRRITVRVPRRFEYVEQGTRR